MNFSHSTAPHTPGPWKIAFPAIKPESTHDHHGYLVIYGGDQENLRTSRDIAYSLLTSQSEFTCSEDDQRECLANARLIAAAPELFTLASTFHSACVDRLSLLKDELEDEWCDREDIQDQIEHWRVLLKLCNGVIANARPAPTKSRHARSKQVSR